MIPLGLMETKTFLVAPVWTGSPHSNQSAIDYLVLFPKSVHRNFLAGVETGAQFPTRPEAIREVLDYLSEPETQDPIGRVLLNPIALTVGYTAKDIDRSDSFLPKRKIGETDSEYWARSKDGFEAKLRELEEAVLVGEVPEELNNVIDFLRAGETMRFATSLEESGKKYNWLEPFLNVSFNQFMGRGTKINWRGALWNNFPDPKSQWYFDEVLKPAWHFVVENIFSEIPEWVLRGIWISLGMIIGAAIPTAAIWIITNLASGGPN